MEVGAAGARDGQAVSSGRLASGWILAVLVLAGAASADYFEVRRNAVVYEEPDRFSTRLAHIAVDPEPIVHLAVTGARRVNGYVEVRLPGSDARGWVHVSRGRMFSGTAAGAVSAEDGTVLRSGRFEVSENAMIAHFIDVGQGDATLLEFVWGLALTDAGWENTKEVDGAALLLEYLESVFERRPEVGRRIGDGNNKSVAVKLVFGESSFLFTVDMEEESLETLVAYLRGNGRA